MNATEGSRFSATYAIDGKPSMHELELHASATAAELLAAVKELHPDLELTEVLIEDEEDVVEGGTRIVEKIRLDFKAVHVTRGGHVEVSVAYEGRRIERRFRPSATIRKVIAWAISGDGFDLLDPPAKFLMKLDGVPQEPEAHLGQLKHGAHELALTLVHSQKPQG